MKRLWVTWELLRRKTNRRRRTKSRNHHQKGKGKTIYGGRWRSTLNVPFQIIISSVHGWRILRISINFRAMRYLERRQSVSVIKVELLLTLRRDSPEKQIKSFIKMFPAFPSITSQPLQCESPPGWAFIGFVIATIPSRDATQGRCWTRKMMEIYFIYACDSEMTSVEGETQ